MAKEWVRKVRNIFDVSKFNLNETLPADLVQDNTGDLWYHAKNKYKQIANDNEVVHLTGDEKISGNKTFNDLLTAKKGINDEGDLTIKGKSTFDDDVKFNGNITYKGDTDWIDLPLEAGYTKTDDTRARYRQKNNKLIIDIYDLLAPAITANTNSKVFVLPAPYKDLTFKYFYPTFVNYKNAGLSINNTAGDGETMFLRSLDAVAANSPFAGYIEIPLT